MPIKFVGEPFCVSKEFWYRKFSSKGGEASRFCRNFFLSHRTQKTSPGNHSVFQKISGREKYFMDKRIRGGGGVHDFPSRFFSHCTEIFHWRTLSCFRKLLLSKIFMHKRGASWFCRNFLSHRTETESFVKEPFCFPEVFWYRKNFMDKRGHITIFYRKFVVSQYRKTS